MVRPTVIVGVIVVVGDVVLVCLNEVGFVIGIVVDVANVQISVRKHDSHTVVVDFVRFVDFLKRRGIFNRFNFRRGARSIDGGGVFVVPTGVWITGVVATDRNAAAVPSRHVRDHIVFVPMLDANARTKL